MIEGGQLTDLSVISEDMTRALVVDFEEIAKGDPGNTLIIGNSAIAAACIILKRAGLTPSEAWSAYKDYWVALETVI